jgi:hypothetical protein
MAASLGLVNITPQLCHLFTKRTESGIEGKRDETGATALAVKAHKQIRAVEQDVMILSIIL